ncbi:hypothetical protein KY366_02975 [Candidatus Woesearchaeota archaeon]|nr:hypothetical protein [Candidatus Woesearchaeota archaeon]
MNTHLTIVPVNISLENEKIYSLAEAIKTDFPLKYSSINIEPNVNISIKNKPSFFMEMTTEEKIDFNSHFPSNTIHYGFDTLRNDGIFKYLRQNYHGDIIALTDHFVLSFLGYLQNGSAYPEDHVSIVSNAVIKRLGLDPIRSLEIITLHELGHLHRLDHDISRVNKMKYCPMTPIHEIRSKNNISLYDTLQYELRSNKYCDKCKTTLRKNSAP